MAGGAEDGVHDGRHRTLAVGSGHVHRCERSLRMAECRDEASDVVQPELDTELFEPEEPRQSIGRHEVSSLKSEIPGSDWQP